MESSLIQQNRAGLGLKAQHYRVVTEDRPDIGWFEVHPENYMGSGGPPHAHLTRIRETYPLSLHGVGLSIGGVESPDETHLERLGNLIKRYQPALVSEHLAWSTHQGAYFNDLLALPYNDETLNIVVRHVDQTQEHLRRRILIENPSTYIGFAASDIDEIDFLTELAGRTGCGLLLDINNVFVSCTNRDEDCNAYVDAFPLSLVEEIHLAGHANDTDAAGHRLLIDTHDRETAPEVWALYERAIAKGGARPTLIEWDGKIPEFPVLAAEAQLAERYLSRATSVRQVPRVA